MSDEETVTIHKVSTEMPISQSTLGWMDGWTAGFNGEHPHNPYRRIVP